MLSTALKKLRYRRGITQADLAETLGVTQQAVARWERNKSEPDFSTLKKLSNYFNVSTDYLLDNGDVSGTPVYHLADEETRLLDGYRALDDSKRQTLVNMLAFLKSQQNASLGGMIQQNNVRGNNNIFANGKGHSFNLIAK